MDGSGDRIRNFVHRRARGGGLVHELGADPRICGICGIPDFTGDCAADFDRPRPALKTEGRRRKTEDGGGSVRTSYTFLVQDMVYTSIIVCWLFSSLSDRFLRADPPAKNLRSRSQSGQAKADQTRR